MHFEVEHEFSAPAERLAEVLCDPAFHTQLDLPDLSRPEVVTSSAEGTARVLRLRYEYIGQVDPIARRVIGQQKLAWIQELRLDTATNTGTLSFGAVADAKRLGGSATVAIVSDDRGHSRRRIAGELHVRVPLIGGNAERRILPGLLRRIDVEAAALSAELTTRA